MENVNFKWLVNDIDSSIVISLCYRDNNLEEECSMYSVLAVLDVVGEKLDIEFANIDDMTKLLNFGIVRFISNMDNESFIDIPFRNLYKLYQGSRGLGENCQRSKEFSLEDMEVFSIFDGSVSGNNYFLQGCLIGEVTDDLMVMMETACDFESLGMQEKMDALSKVNMINYRRIENYKKER